MRYVVLAALVVLVGGYVVGQQVDALPGAPGEKVEDGLPQSSGDNFRLVWDHESVHRQLDAKVGRYVPFGNDRLLDTTNGTVYRINGNAWVDVVKMKEPKTPMGDLGTDGLDVDELLRAQRDQVDLAYSGRGFVGEFLTGLLLARTRLG